MNDLELKYGYCVIPKNTLLFRGYEIVDLRDILYFGTKFNVAKGFNENVQIWKTLADIRVLFMVDSLNESRVKSSISDIYNSYFPVRIPHDSATKLFGYPSTGLNKEL